MENDKETVEKGFSSGFNAVIHGLLSFIPAKLREMVGFFSGMVLLFAFPIALILGVMTLYYAKERAKVAEVPCWNLQAIGNRVFKLNSCTGEVTEFKASPASPPQKKGK
jgi:hypothetical protein